LRWASAVACPTSITDASTEIAAAIDAASLREGDKSAEVYVLVEGDAEIRIGTDGRVVGIVGQGAFLGEVAALVERPRTASVIAKPVLAARHGGARHDIGRRGCPRARMRMGFNYRRLCRMSGILAAQMRQ
jgi:hypothetical protein